MGQITSFLQSNLSCLKRTTGPGPSLSTLICHLPRPISAYSTPAILAPLQQLDLCGRAFVLPVPQDFPWLAALLFRSWLKCPLFQEAFPDFIATVIPGVFLLIYILVYSLAFPSEQGLNCMLLILMPGSWKAFGKYLVME